MALTKDSIINETYNQCGLSKSKSIEAVEFLLETIKQTLESGEDVLITRFGKFYAKDKSEGRGRSYQIGGDMMLESTKVVLKCSRILKNRIYDAK